MRTSATHLSFLLNKTQKQGLKTPSEFINKLLAILQDPQCEMMISWTPCGQCIILKDLTKIASDLLPKYFNHAKIPTLVRQLNYYGFKKISSTAGKAVYCNSNFQKDRPDLLINIKREKKKPVPKPSQSEPASSQNFDESTSVLVKHIMKKLMNATRLIEQLKLEREFLLRRSNEMRTSRNLRSEMILNQLSTSNTFEEPDTMHSFDSRESGSFGISSQNSAQDSADQMPEDLQALSSFEYKLFASEEPQLQLPELSADKKYFSNEDRRAEDVEDSFITFSPFKDQEQDYFN